MVEVSLDVMIEKFTQVSKSALERLIEIKQRVLRFFSEEFRQKYGEAPADLKIVDQAVDALKAELEKAQDEVFIEEKAEDLSSAHFLAKLRHDLRNPINAILGYTELSLEDLEEVCSEEWKEELKKAVVLVREILDLVDEIRPLEETWEKTTEEAAEGSFVIEELEEGGGSLRLSDEEISLFKESFSILIVDDVIDNCKLLERYLLSLGYKKVDMAFDGLEALEKLNHQQVDLILLDINMPKMDGIELLKRLQDKIKANKLMVMMITASNTIKNDVKCIKLGAVDVLPKPFNVDILRVRIGGCLERKWFAEKEELYRKQIEEDKAKYKELLHSIFPPTVVEELITTGEVKARLFEGVAVLFTDVVSFTTYCDSHSPSEIIKNVQEVAEICETAVMRHNSQKIKTVGDGFLAIAGMLTDNANPVLDCVQCAMEILERTSMLASGWRLRAGIDFGPVIGGVVGHRQFLYDIWSDTVNTSARLQGLAEPGRLCLSKRAWEQVKDSCRCTFMGVQPVKGKEPMSIYRVDEVIRRWV